MRGTGAPFRGPRREAAAAPLEGCTRRRVGLPPARPADGVITSYSIHYTKLYDMPWMLARHEGLKATFNITPPLIEQLELYYNNPAENDYFLSLWLRHPETLNEKERQWMIKLS